MIIGKQVLCKIMKKVENVNFRFFIKTQYRLGIQTIEIFYELKTIYNDQAPSYATVAH